MPHPCDVVQVKWKAPGDARISYAIWVGTNICVGTLFSIRGTISEGMTYDTEDNYALIYPSPKYPTTFHGTIDLSKFGDFKRICESIAPPCKQLDERGRKMEGWNAPLFKPLDWIRAVLTRSKDEGILEHALETSQLLRNDPEYVDGFTEPSSFWGDDRLF